MLIQVYVSDTASMVNADRTHKAVSCKVTCPGSVLEKVAGLSGLFVRTRRLRSSEKVITVFAIK